MLVELLILVAIVFFLYQHWSKRDVFKLGKELNSGVRTLPLVGHSYLFLGNNQRRMKAFQILGRDAIRKDDGLSSMWHGSYLYTMIAEPNAAELVLKTCLEKDDIMKMAKLFLGNGSIFAPVSIWRPRRKVLVPSFGMKNMKQFMSIFVKQSGILVQQVKKVAGTGPVPMWRHFTAYTMDSISEVTLGYEMDAQKGSNHNFLKAFEEGLARGADRLCQPWLHSDLVYTNLPVYPKLLQLKKYLWDFIDELIKSKRKEMKEENIRQECDQERSLKTFLELLIRSSGGDEGYTDVEVIEEAMVIMVAGNDTSAVGASFITVMLSRHPDVQEKVYKDPDKTLRTGEPLHYGFRKFPIAYANTIEKIHQQRTNTIEEEQDSPTAFICLLRLKEVFGDSDRPVTFEDLPRLKYLDAVIRETLRLYPPVPIITRSVEKNVVLPTGIIIVPGTGAIVNIWALHRNPRYWGEDAEQFRPERFIDTPLKHPAAFMPFSHGPRSCVGYQFAMTSMKTVMSSLLRHYRILPATAPNSKSEHPPLRLKFDLMMKDEDDYQVQIESRCK